MKILFIRRDNIGDLICTTPAIRAVRKQFPDAKIGILVNTYNHDVIVDNPDIDEIYIYEKAKHAPDKNKVTVWWNNVKVLQKIRKAQYNVALGCGSYSPRLARYTFFTGAKIRIGYSSRPKKIFYNNPVSASSAVEHEVLKTFRLLNPIGINGIPGSLVLIPDPEKIREFETFKEMRVKNVHLPLLAIAISARIKKNQWTLDKFSILIREILKKNIVNILLLWSPGSRDNPTFPGDDEAARIILSQFNDKIMAYPTPTLKSLIAAISSSDVVVTLDTGTLHMSAAAKKPTVALMTKTKSLYWYPWKTRNVVLTAENEVAAISVDEVLEAVNYLI